MNNGNAPPPPTEPVVAPEMAEHEFDRFTKGMELDVDVSAMGDEEELTFKKYKRQLILALGNGSLIINDNFEPVLTPRRSPVDKSITFYEKDGSVMLAIDGKKKNESMRQVHAALGVLTKSHPSVFSKLKGSDYDVCIALFTLLVA